MNDVQDMEPVLEAILFVANEPVSRERLLEVFEPAVRETASQALDAVLERYRESSARGVVVDEAAGGIRFVTRPDLHGYLRRFYELSGNTRLSMPALETLAIIAYRQPVTAPEIQELRGVGSSGVLKTLLERRLVRIAGRKEVVGKPFLYATTREFLMRFGLSALKDLPPLEQFEELYGSEAADEAEDGAGEHDHEEDVLRQAALIEEQRDDEDEPGEEPDEPEDDDIEDDNAEEDSVEDDTVEDEVVEEDDVESDEEALNQDRDEHETTNESGAEAEDSEAAHRDEADERDENTTEDEP